MLETVFDFLSQYTSSYYTEQIVEIVDAIIFLLFVISIIYLFIFAVKALGKSNFIYPKSPIHYRFAVIIPAYKEDNVIISSIRHFFNQNYPPDKYEVIIVSNGMSYETISELRSLSAKVVEMNNEKSSKTKALKTAVDYILKDTKKYDIVVTLDADNLVENNYLEKINDAFYCGCSSVQTHRIAKNLNTSTAILDAVSEEINNSIFRKGHTRLGLSSGLIGSGMAFELDIFKKYIHKCNDNGVEKQLEYHLLRDNVYIEYLNTVFTYDEKVKKSDDFYQQRGRWISNQLSNLSLGLKTLPAAILYGRWDLANKIFQWLMVPRIVLLGFIIIFGVLTSLYYPSLCAKWWGLLGFLLITLGIAIPDYLVSKKLFKAVLYLPFLFFLMLINLIKAPFCSSKHTHTKHYEK